MAECREISHLLGRYLYADLADRERGVVEAHLASHPGCRRWVAEARSALAALPACEPTAEQINTIMRNTRAAVRTIARSPSRYLRLLAAVGIGLLLIMGGLSLRQGSKHGGSALRPGDVGMVASAVGTPLIRKVGGEWRVAEQYDTLRVGDRLRTGDSEGLGLWFTDGSRMRIGPGSEVALLSPGNNSSRPATVRLGRGNVSVAVAKARSRFAVDTPAANATATGTRFGLDAAPRRTTLAVFSGSVMFSNESGSVTATGPVRTTATAGAAPSEPVSIGMYDLLQGASGTLRDDFDTPPLDESVWIPHVLDPGILIAQQNGRLTIHGARLGDSPISRARLLTYFLPRQSFSAAVSFRLGPDSQEGVGLDVGSGEARTGGGVSFQPEIGYRFNADERYWVSVLRMDGKKGEVPPFGDEREAFHRLRLEYSASSNLLTGYVDDVRVGDPVRMEEPYFSLGFGTASGTEGIPIALEFDDFEADFAGGTPELIALQPSATPLAAKSPGVVLDVGPPDAWDGRTVYNPSVIKRGQRYEMWYAADPPGGSWYQSRIGLAYSDDGIMWRKYEGNPVIEEAGMGAPCVLYGDWRDGKRPCYKMWYRYYEPPSKDRQGLQSMLAYATSRDGIHWASHGVIAGRSPGDREAWGFRISSPSVLYLPDVPGLPDPYLLYYYSAGRYPDVALATSPDGIHWQPRGVVLEPSPPGEWDSRRLDDGRVVYAGGKFHMLYAGYGPDPRLGSAIGYAVSEDGIHWRRADRLAVAGSNIPGEPDFGLAQPAPLLDGDTIRIWYVGGPYSGLFGFWGHNIGYAQMPVSSLSR